MDIQLSRSRILFVVRVLAAIGALFALSIASVSTPIRALMILLLVLQCLQWSDCAHSICGFTWEHELLTNSADQASRVNLALKLSDGRWLQVHLTHFYCLWWIQILEFRSASARHTLIVLPDCCSSNDRRRIRNLLLAGKLQNQAAKP